MFTGDHQTYRTSEFAKLAGITVRALRHYDHVGLLRPRRTQAGHRIYTSRDLNALEEIVALKALGVPLSTIASVRGGATALAAALRAQRERLQEQRRRLDKTMSALTGLEEELQAGTEATPALFRRIIEALAMQNDSEEWEAAYATLLHRWQARRPALAQEMMAELGQEWESLATDVQHALTRGDDRRGPSAQQLAARWLRLLRRLYGDDVSASTFRVAGRNVENWSPSFGVWPGWKFLSEALSICA